MCEGTWLSNKHSTQVGVEVAGFVQDEFASIHWMLGFTISFKLNRLILRFFVCQYPTMKSPLMLLILSILATIPLQAGGFSQKLEMNGLSFTISSPNKSDGNTVTIKPHGLKNGDAPITQSVDGLVTKVEMDNLGGDGSQELFVYTTSPGSGSYGKAYAWSTNGKKVLTAIFITPPGKKDMTGYMGHDEFAIVENAFIRRFPVYKSGDSNASPSGGWRQFQYHLHAGEAGWVLRIYRVVSF